MSCYHPLYALYIRSNVQSTGVGYTPLILGEYDGSPLDENHILIPCGQCIGCRLDKSRQWADRMMIELDHSKVAIFVTLTYSDANLVPAMYDDVNDSWYYSLYKPDFQKFMKRLRFHFSDREIRYYACGEYGDTTCRPHYHAILFGLDLLDFPDLIAIGKNHIGQTLFTSPLLASIWKKGIISLAPVSWQTCAYVSRYVTKKLTGERSKEYFELNLVPPFACMSLKPGIGGFFAIDHPELLSENYVYISDFNSHSPRNKVSMPKYLFKKLETYQPALYNEIKLQKSKFAQDKMLIELSKTDLGYCDYLLTKEANHEASASKLKRK